MSRPRRSPDSASPRSAIVLMAGWSCSDRPYTPSPGAAPLHLPYPRAALAFMGWQPRRGLLNPLDDERPGSPWWRAVNERLLRDTCEARLRLLGHPGPASSPSVEPSVRFARQPSPWTWYLAHNVTIVRAYIDHRYLAERENRVERFFINLILVRVLVRPRPRRRAAARTGLARADRPMARRSAAGYDGHVPLGVAGSAAPVSAGG